SRGGDEYDRCNDGARRSDHPPPPRDDGWRRRYRDGHGPELDWDGAAGDGAQVASEFARRLIAARRFLLEGAQDESLDSGRDVASRPVQRRQRFVLDGVERGLGILALEGGLARQHFV